MAERHFVEDKLPTPEVGNGGTVGRAIAETTRSHTESVVIHASAGWCRVACMSERAPDGTRSTIKVSDVNCPECKALLGHVTDDRETQP